MNENNIFTCLGISLVFMIMMSQGAYAGVAGHAQFVSGSVEIVNLSGQTRALQKGDPVNEGDTLISAQSASAQIRMEDGGIVAMRPNTKLKIDLFKFNGQQDGTERSFFSLFSGGFRAITGLIGKVNKLNYRITTDTAIIGVRGTDHETFVVAPDSMLAKTVPIGIYNKVNIGETTITTKKGTISILPNQMGFAGSADQMPELRPLNTNIFTVIDKPIKEAKSKKEDKVIREHAAVDNNVTVTVTRNENGVANGVGNGVTNGVGNGVTNGVGNGITNGVGNGVTNGVGNGITNGVGNGVANGVGNGVANGVGKAKGL